MKRESREEAARRLASDISNGATLPHDVHTGTRVIMPRRLARATDNTCVVCGTGLVGRQKTFCFGHWDYLTVPTEAAQDPEAFVAYLTQTFNDVRVVHIQRHWLAVINGHSRCDVCDVLTSNVERLVAGNDRILKQHTVCPDHQSLHRSPLDSV